jgi:RecA/RadA recombinase
MPADTKIIELRQFLAERLPQARLGMAPERMVPAALPTGIESIDQGLGGGLPQGAFTELVAPGEGSGSAQFIHSLLRHTASAGRFLTLVDGADSLDIDALEPDALAHLLWVRCRSTAEALQTTDLLLRDRNIALVVLDLKLNPAHELRRIPGTLWYRLSRLMEQHGGTVLVITPQPLVAGAAARIVSQTRLDHRDLERSPDTLDLRFETEQRRVREAGARQTA